MERYLFIITIIIMPIVTFRRVTGLDLVEIGMAASIAIAVGAQNVRRARHIMAVLIREIGTGIEMGGERAPIGVGMTGTGAMTEIGMVEGRSDATNGVETVMVGQLTGRGMAIGGISDSSIFFCYRMDYLSVTAQRNYRY